MILDYDINIETLLRHVLLNVQTPLLCVFVTLQYNTSLTRLRLSDNTLGADGIRFLTTVLRTHPTLTHLVSSVFKRTTHWGCSRVCVDIKNTSSRVFFCLSEFRNYNVTRVLYCCSFNYYFISNTR